MVLIRKKICIDCRMIEHSGIGTYLKNIIPQIIFREPNIDFILLGDSYKIEKYLDTNLKNYQIIQMDASIFSLGEQFDFLIKIPQDIDLMWSPHFNIPIFYKKCLLVTVHDVFFLAMPQYIGGNYKHLYAKFLFMIIKNKSKKILTVSSFTKNEIVKYTKINEEIISPIHLGVDTSNFNNKQTNIKHNKPFVLFVGNVKMHKNLLLLIKAFNLIKDEIPHDLIIVGKREVSGIFDKNLQGEYEQSKERIIFTGFIDDEELIKFYKSADMFIFPSLYEGFGLPLLEAMACGCPIISSNAASLPEIGGDAVVYFDPYSIIDLANSIKLLYRHPEMRKELISKGYQQIEKFKWNTCVEKILENIRRIL